MKLLILVALVGTALAAPGLQAHGPMYNYLEAIGVPKADSIRASEEASDFDGARIIGGSGARLGQFPHMGGVIIHLQNGREAVCGSSLISNTRLVTSAHCWFDGRQNARQLTIVLGSIRLFQGGVRTNTNRVTIHPQYSTQTLANDIAMVQIGHVGFNNNIRSIALASGTNTFAGSNAVASGFGVTGPNHQIGPNQSLAYVSLPVITNQQCANFFGTRMVVASTICTWGQTGRNICGSDSGGPLQVGNTLVGVTSFGAASCASNAPAAYARVSSFISWIRNHM